ncbi:hypothetical protein [Angustibacter aerolatus]
MWSPSRRQVAAAAVYGALDVVVLVLDPRRWEVVAVTCDAVLWTLVLRGGRLARLAWWVLVLATVGAVVVQVPRSVPLTVVSAVQLVAALAARPGGWSAQRSRTTTRPS